MTSQKTQPLLSIVVPLFNEESTLARYESELTPALEALSPNFEVIAVDDGSHDGTLAALESLRAADPRYKVLKLSRNFGHQAAIWAGLHYAKGEQVGIMDGDLQDPPSYFAPMAKELAQGQDLIYTVRTNPKTQGWKKPIYKAYYSLLRLGSEIDIPADSGDFCLMNRRFLNALLALPGQPEFIRGTRAWLGFRQKAFPYERKKRAEGKSEYTLRKLLRLAGGGIFGYGKLPLLMISGTAITLGLTSVLYFLYLLVASLLNWPVPAGLWTLAALGAFFSSLILGALRLIGEYLRRAMVEAQGRPSYVVDSFLDSREG